MFAKDDTRTAQETSPPPPASHMPRRVVAESESEEEETAAEEGPGHVAMGEDDTEALSAAPTAVHASNAAVHAPHGFGCTHLLELPDELLLLVLASLPVGRSHPLSLRAKRFERCRRGRAKPDFALTVSRRTRPSRRVLQGFCEYRARGCIALRSLPRLDGALGVPVVGVHDAHRSTQPCSTKA